ncbi:MAG: hypothetical protein IPQ09_07545 [Myxococcales bacterium]|nr:hypothetical protein [Myxococcales bacterium]
MKTKFGLGFGVFVLLFGAAAGCGTTTVVEEGDASTAALPDSSVPDTNPLQPDTPPPQPDTSGPDASGPDAAAPDAADAGVDSGLGARPGETVDPFAPKPGDPCPGGVNLNEIVERRCGKCGIQQGRCIAGPGGAKVVDTYGACTGEKTDPAACLPRERIVSGCGFCGTKNKDCDLNCAYVESVCAEAPFGCAPNGITYLEGTCTNPGQTRRQVCSPTCVKGPTEACADQFLNDLFISQTPGTTVSGEYTAYANTVGRLTPGPCPSTVTGSASYHYVRVNNTGLMEATVTLANGTPAGTTRPDAVVAVYSGPDAPISRNWCVGSVSDSPQSITTVIPRAARWCSSRWWPRPSSPFRA